ncbi:hypothetical protein BIV59_18655 [Bacillus sp. MUM 13]|nr:hypothetical protein BIV59_18655 [Bacillus sp. MUM 13]
MNISVAKFLLIVRLQSTIKMNVDEILLLRYDQVSLETNIITSNNIIYPIADALTFNLLMKILEATDKTSNSFIFLSTEK